MVQLPQPKVESSSAAAAGGHSNGMSSVSLLVQSTPGLLSESGINATAELGGGTTVHPDTDALPDLSRLALGDPGVGAPGLRLHGTSGGLLPGSGVHLAVYSQGGPITINVNPPPQVALQPATWARVPLQEATVHAPPPPARIRLAPAPVATTEAVADTATEDAAPPPPVEPGSPTLQSVPASATASPVPRPCRTWTTLQPVSL